MEGREEGGGHFKANSLAFATGTWEQNVARKESQTILCLILILIRNFEMRVAMSRICVLSSRL